LNHYLNVKHKYFKDIESGIKTFEVRTTNNRTFKINDTIILKDETTKKIITKTITYINDISIYNINNIVILAFK